MAGARAKPVRLPRILPRCHDLSICRLYQSVRGPTLYRNQHNPPAARRMAAGVPALLGETLNVRVGDRMVRIQFSDEATPRSRSVQHGLHRSGCHRTGFERLPRTPQTASPLLVEVRLRFSQSVQVNHADSSSSDTAPFNRVPHASQWVFVIRRPPRTNRHAGTSTSRAEQPRIPHFSFGG